MKRLLRLLRLVFEKSNVKSIAEMELMHAQLQLYEAREAYEWAKALEAFNKAKVVRLTRMLERMGG
jgi:hypothetical protein